jgi:hypothetical protein
MRRSALLFDLHNRPTSVFTLFLRDVQIPGDDLSTIDEALQKRFFQKGPDGQPLERWELKEVKTSCSRNQLMRHLAACGFLLSTDPESSSYTRAGWPGALASRAAARLLDLLKAWDKCVWWQEIIAFGSYRPLQPDKENFENCCLALGIDPAARISITNKDLWNKINPQTEIDMMNFLWQTAIYNYVSPALDRVPVVFVGTPMKPPVKEGGPLVRPNTEDTINDWLRSNPTPGSMLVSSGAPYGMAQDEAFWSLLPQGHTIETFGHTAPDLPIESFMREVAGCVHRIRQTRLGS